MKKPFPEGKGGRRRVSERNRRRRLLARRLKVAPQGRMRGKLPDADRKRVLLANSALISPLRGQLPPQGKPFQFTILIYVYPRFGGVFVLRQIM